MGRRSRQKPRRLAGKLRRMRTSRRLSQDGLISYIGLQGQIRRQDISDFERGKREPSLAILLAYAQAAGVTVEILIDDKRNLP